MPSAVSNAGMHIESIPWCQQSGGPFPHFCNISLQNDWHEILHTCFAQQLHSTFHLKVIHFWIRKIWKGQEPLEMLIFVLAVSNQEYVLLTALRSTQIQPARLWLAWFQALPLAPSQKLAAKRRWEEYCTIYQLFTDARRQVLKQRHGIISADDLQTNIVPSVSLRLYRSKGGDIAKIVTSHQYDKLNIPQKPI